MDDTKTDAQKLDEITQNWMKSANDLWGTVAKLWLEPLEVSAAKDADLKTASDSAKATVYTAMKNWKAISGALSNPDSVEPLLKTAGTMPDVLLKLAQVGFGGFVEMQQKWLEFAGRVGQTTEAYQYKGLDESLFQAWSELYEKEFRKFLYVPQIGLTRTYQEKLNKALDQYNIFQSAIAEFLRVLSLPLARSVSVMQEKIGEMAESGELPDDPKALYNLWIKVLEGHYMTLYQSEEYTVTLGKTLQALSAFSASKKEVLEDLMAGLPIPSQSEIDDIAKELYALKKRIRKLEKQQQ